jgi:hypothetical protein
MKGLWTFVRTCGAAIGLLALLVSASCGGKSETSASKDPQEIALIRMEPGDGETRARRPRARIPRRSRSSGWSPVTARARYRATAWCG